MTFEELSLSDLCIIRNTIKEKQKEILEAVKKVEVPSDTYVKLTVSFEELRVKLTKVENRINEIYGLIE